MPPRSARGDLFQKGGQVLVHQRDPGVDRPHERGGVDRVDDVTGRGRQRDKHGAVAELFEALLLDLGKQYALRSHGSISIVAGDQGPTIMSPSDNFGQTTARRALHPFGAGIGLAIVLSGASKNHLQEIAENLRSWVHRLGA